MLSFPYFLIYQPFLVTYLGHLINEVTKLQSIHPHAFMFSYQIILDNLPIYSPFLLATFMSGANP